MRRTLAACSGLLFACGIEAQQGGKERWTADRPPGFENFPVSEIWKGQAARVRLTTRSERLFRTNLTNAGKEPPNFAGHYRLTFWGCGSNCAAGAVIDLKTGSVYRPPQAIGDGTGWVPWIISGAMMDGAAVDFRANSRLVIVRSGMNYSDRLKKFIPDTRYFLWESNRFRRILFVPGKEPGGCGE
jgi:hypothetical protein